VTTLPCRAALLSLPALAAATFVQLIRAPAFDFGHVAAASGSRSAGDSQPDAAPLVCDVRQPDEPPIATARDAVEIAKALAKLPGPLLLHPLTRISPKALGALIEKPDVRLPNIDSLELIPEPDRGFRGVGGIPGTAAGGWHRGDPACAADPHADSAGAGPSAGAVMEQTPAVSHT
jgi:hypothetical protein